MNMLIAGVVVLILIVVLVVYCFFKPADKQKQSLYRYEGADEDFIKKFKEFELTGIGIRVGAVAPNGKFSKSNSSDNSVIDRQIVYRFRDAVVKFLGGDVSFYDTLCHIDIKDNSPMNTKYKFWVIIELENGIGSKKNGNIDKMEKNSDKHEYKIHFRYMRLSNKKLEPLEINGIPIEPTIIKVKSVISTTLQTELKDDPSRINLFSGFAGFKAAITNRPTVAMLRK